VTTPPRPRAVCPAPPEPTPHPRVGLLFSLANPTAPSTPRLLSTSVRGDYFSSLKGLRLLRPAALPVTARGGGAGSPPRQPGESGRRGPGMLPGVGDTSSGDAPGRSGVLGPGMLPGGGGETGYPPEMLPGGGYSP